MDEQSKSPRSLEIVAGAAVLGGLVLRYVLARRRGSAASGAASSSPDHASTPEAPAVPPSGVSPGVVGGPKRRGLLGMGTHRGESFDGPEGQGFTERAARSVPAADPSVQQLLQEQQKKIEELQEDIERLASEGPERAQQKLLLLLQQEFLDQQQNAALLAQMLRMPPAETNVVRIIHLREQDI